PRRDLARGRAAHGERRRPGGHGGIVGAAGQLAPGSRAAGMHPPRLPRYAVRASRPRHVDGRSSVGIRSAPVAPADVAPAPPVRLALLGGVLLAGRVLDGLEPWLAETAKEAAVSTLQARVMRHAAGLDLAAFEHQGYYDQLDRVLTGAEVRWAPMLGHALGLV